MVTRTVRSTDGTQLAVEERGDRAAPTVIAVHGYPDNRHVWDEVADRLAERFHVVSYDVRGCGDSDKPRLRSDYRQEQLTEDQLAVIDAVSPDAPVHLLAHDWGSIQTWATLSDPRADGRVASYTSISGPSLDHAGAWLRAGRKHPADALRQLAHSYYIALFQLPGLPEAAARRGLIDRAISAGTTQAPASGYERTEADRVNGISLYRANVRRILRPRPQRIDVPVQVLALTGDAYVTAPLAIGAPAPWVADLTVHYVDGGHWILTEDPEIVAAMAAAHIDTHSRREAS